MNKGSSLYKPLGGALIQRGSPYAANLAVDLVWSERPTGRFGDASGNNAGGTWAGSGVSATANLYGPSVALGGSSASGSIPAGLPPIVTKIGSWSIIFTPAVLPTSGNFQYILSDDIGAGSTSFVLDLNNPSGTTVLELAYNSGGYVHATNATGLVAGKRYHAVITTDGTNVKFYLNGSLDSSSTYTTTPTPQANIWRFGSRFDGAATFTGSFEGFAYWPNRVLRAAEILDLYQYPYGRFVTPSRPRIFGRIIAAINHFLASMGVGQ